MSVNWSKLTDDEKAPYNEQSNKDKVRYKQEIEAYNKKKKAEEKDAYSLELRFGRTKTKLQMGVVGFLFFPQTDGIF